MASTKIFFIIAIVAVFAIPSILAKEFVVGDYEGWTILFDYEAWAMGKEFRVGDKLVFKYKEGAHNVIEVHASDFKQCVVPPASEALTTGNDVITLTRPGIKSYICGIGKHCEMGKQKLAITVLPQLASSASSPSGSLAPASIPTSAERGSTLLSPVSSHFGISPAPASVTTPSVRGSPAPASVTTSAARGSTASTYYGWMVVIFATLVMVMV